MLSSNRFRILLRAGWEMYMTSHARVMLRYLAMARNASICWNVMLLFMGPSLSSRNAAALRRDGDGMDDLSDYNNYISRRGGIQAWQ